MTTVHPDQPNGQVRSPQEIIGYIAYDDPLATIRALCEALPDRPQPGHERIWTETVNAIHAIACDAIDRTAAGRDRAGGES